MSLIPTISQTLSLLTLLTQIALGLGIIILLTPNRRHLLALVSRQAHAIGYVVTLAAMMGSLFYSEIAGYAPCKLCWYQRILMYPMVLLMTMASAKRDQGIFRYTLALSLIGAGIALYHYALQLGLVPELNCTVTGYSAKCSDRFAMEYGYITIPMMALTAFVTVAVTSLIAMRAGKSEQS